MPRTTRHLSRSSARPAPPAFNERQAAAYFAGFRGEASTDAIRTNPKLRAAYDNGVSARRGGHSQTLRCTQANHFFG